MTKVRHRYNHWNLFPGKRSLQNAPSLFEWTIFVRSAIWIFAPLIALPFWSRTKPCIPFKISLIRRCLRGRVEPWKQAILPWWTAWEYFQSDLKLFFHSCVNSFAIGYLQHDNSTTISKQSLTWLYLMVHNVCTVFDSTAIEMNLYDFVQNLYYRLSICLKPRP